MNNAARIKPHQTVVDCNDEHFSVVDRMEGKEIIKLTKDDRDMHHYIPLIWVSAIIDDIVHLKISAKQAARLWMTANPDEASMTLS